MASFTLGNLKGSFRRGLHLWQVNWYSWRSVWFRK